MRRIEMRKRWKCLYWTGPNGETGHGLWLEPEQFVQDAAWCEQMNSRYPGWTHCIHENLGRPPEAAPEGWATHPFFGDMRHGPKGL